jgi:AsmA protein
VAFSGNLSADVNVAGRVKKTETIKTNGKVTLEQLGIVYRNVHTVIDGNLNLKGQSVDFDLLAAVGENNAELKGYVRNYMKDQKIKLDVYSKKLVLDEIIPSEKTGDVSPTQKTKPGAGKAAAEPGPLNLMLSADGEIRVDKALYRNMAMTDFIAKYRFINNKIEISNMSAKAGKGRFNLTSFTDLSVPGYRYRLSANIDDLHADEIVNSFFPKAKDTVYGILTAKLKMKGSGAVKENIRKNLVGDGDFVLREGKITNSKLPSQLALFLGINELRTINLTKADGRVKIHDGTARLNSAFVSQDISMNPSGTIGLDESLALAFDLKLSPRLADKALRNPSISSYIKDETGWGIIPLKISGTLSAPSYSIDIEKAGKRVIKKKGVELLEKLLDKKKSQQEGGEEKREKGSPVEGLIKGLFK